MADGLDLGHVNDHDLAELGRLDVIDQHPTLHPDVAVALETLTDERDQAETIDQAIARLGCRGCAFGSVRHWPCTRPRPADARDALSDPPKQIDQGNRDGSREGRGDHHSGERWQDRVRNEGLDPITEYLKNVPDEPDENWS